jgi:two-component system sensor histidine kinase CpxA
MRSLFLKIFLWFWLAMAAIVVAVVLVTAAAQTQTLDAPQRAAISSAMRERAERAVAIYENRGAESLRRHLRRSARRSGSQVFLFAPDGHEVLGQEVPPSVVALHQRVLHSAQPDTLLEMAGTDFLAAHPVRGENGAYVFIDLRSRSLLHAASLSARFMSPRMKALRLITILLVTGLVCYGLARYLASPIIALRHATQQLAQGDLSVRVAPKIGRRRDELADLARDFDGMAERIGALLSTQRRLLSDISHELRSPLARLQLALSLAEREIENEKAPSREKLHNNLERIARESARLDALIGQLLALTRFESGAAQRKQEEFDLLELARVVAEDADFEARGQNKHVLLQSDECDSYSLRGDRELLRSALENVVRNAIRHTLENSVVTISCTKEDANGVLRVCDEGAGVAEEHLSLLFEPFFRADDARQHDGGVGLGLAITRRAVESHGGQVVARNSENGGLCVEMKLPMNLGDGKAPG